jgi:peptidoglycan biosynthesis protein MviN/MurJ (putative lipid II flippase)
MLWKGALAGLLLMLGSRVLGLLRETALAASLGASAEADVAITLILVPDLVVGVLAGGALSLVLLPYWAGIPPERRWRSQQWVVKSGASLAATVALALALWPGALHWLVPGVMVASPPAGLSAAWWVTLAACPLAMAASVWATRSQAESDMVGFFGGNFIFSSLVMLALAAVYGGARPEVLVVGVGVWLACLVRSVWSWRRVQAFAPGQQAVVSGSPLRSQGRLWASVVVSAVLASAAPMLLALGARALASQQGGGALAIFAYAWKLVELPWSAGIQVVAAVAFASLAAVVSAAGVQAGGGRRIQFAFVAAMGVALAAAGLIALASETFASWLYGWGRMRGDVASLAEVAALARTAAWALPALALHAVGAILVACASRLRHLILPVTLVLAATFATLAHTQPSDAMLIMVLGQWGLALATMVVAAPVLIQARKAS